MHYGSGSAKAKSCGSCSGSTTLAKWEEILGGKAEGKGGWGGEGKQLPDKERGKKKEKKRKGAREDKTFSMVMMVTIGQDMRNKEMQGRGDIGT
jgi:hypothetical protein